ncbi:MAG TPA: glycosyltransferase family 2 protein, partial [Thermoflexales bacterium]|nr:glycosyltransferase family 2 protein [Thermoflexales bacterium]
MGIQAKSSSNLLPNTSGKNPINDKINLSILIPVYNERHLVAASVNRVLALKSDLISHLEVIIVDDCSQDGSWDIIQQIAARDERVRAVRQKHNQGKGAAIRAARDL